MAHDDVITTLEQQIATLGTLEREWRALQSILPAQIRAAFAANDAEMGEALAAQLNDLRRDLPVLSKYLHERQSYLARLLKAANAK